MLSSTHLRREGEDYEAQILSKAVKAGRRTYFFDVRHARRRLFPDHHREPQNHGPDGTPSYDRHKIFLSTRRIFRNSPMDCTRSSSSSAAARRAPSLGGIARSDPFRSARGNRLPARFRRKMRRSPATAPLEAANAFRTRCPGTCRGRRRSGSGRPGRMCALRSAAFRGSADCGKSSAANAFLRTGCSLNPAAGSGRTSGSGGRRRGAKNGRLPKN